MPSRREILGSVAALPVLGQTYKPKTFNSEELTLIRGLAGIIIPRTDTPGAADVHVDNFIDRAFTTKPARLSEFRQGLRLAASQVKRGRKLEDIVAGFHEQRHPFFGLLKDLTVDGYYSTREGLQQELGWHGYTPQHEFPGCTHPEHKG